MSQTPETWLKADIRTLIQPVVLRMCRRCKPDCFGQMTDGQLPECFELRDKYFRLSEALIDLIPEPGADATPGKQSAVQARIERLSQWLNTEVGRLTKGR